MKKLILVLIVSQFLTSCAKTVDDTNNACTSNCTTLSGKFITLNNQPVPNIKVRLKYVRSNELAYFARKLVDIKSDQNGNFYNDFFIKDNELGLTDGYFQAEVDDSNIDNNNYIRINNLTGGGYQDLSYVIYHIFNRDTIIDKSFYIPKKAFIKVNLNNFVIQQPGDTFEVQTLYPFGEKIGINPLLDSEYATGFSGYGIWTATNLNTSFNVFVAEGENNIIRIIKRKNGIASSQDFLVTVPPNNTIELTYNF